MGLARIKRILLGQPLTVQHLTLEKIPKWKALSTLSSDALSSVAYATEEILLTLAAFSVASVSWSIPIAVAIVVLLTIITISYRQTIEAYPSGGGAYTVAKENLGVNAGLIAGASLLIDYVLTVSVSVAAGMENIASAIPNLGPYKVAIGCLVILVMMVMNLRGIRDSSTVFSFPTYFFVLSIILLVVVGLVKLLTGTLHSAESFVHPAYAAVPAILIFRAFASGCSALTGVEAISNGVPVFKEPAQHNAKITLMWMSVLLGGMFIGITGLAHVLGLVPHEGETLISLLGASVFGRGFFYYCVQVATALILFLAANTSYADFPRLASLLARDRFLPRQLASLGDRLVFSNGIIGLSLVAAFLIYMFGGETSHLIPLYALGVFLSFTLSQAGMVAHHLRDKEPRWIRSLIINAIGALTTFLVLLDIATTKFLHGAWMVVLMIPLLVAFFKRIRSHYEAVGRELALRDRKPPLNIQKLKHTIIIPVASVHQGVLEAVEYALSLSTNIRACYVEIDQAATQRVREEWNHWVPQIPLVVLPSPYRSLTEPIIRYVDDVEREGSDDMVTVVIPEFVTTRWWHSLLHNHSALFIRAALATRRRKVVTSIRYHLNTDQ